MLAPDCMVPGDRDSAESSLPRGAVPVNGEGIVPDGASVAASFCESSFRSVGFAEVTATSSSSIFTSPSGCDGINCKESPAGNSEVSPETLIWIPSAPPVTNGSVPLGPVALSGPVPVSESTRYHSLHPAPSSTRR